MRVFGVFVVLALMGCGKPPTLLGRVEDVVGVQGDYFPNSEDQRVSFRGGAADAQAIARVVLRGKPCEAAKWCGRAAFHLRFVDGRSQSVEVFKPGAVIEIGGSQFGIDMAELEAILARLSSSK